MHIWQKLPRWSENDSLGPRSDSRCPGAREQVPSCLYIIRLLPSHLCSSFSLRQLWLTSYHSYTPQRMPLYSLFHSCFPAICAASGFISSYQNPTFHFGILWFYSYMRKLANANAYQGHSGNVRWMKQMGHLKTTGCGKDSGELERGCLTKGSQLWSLKGQALQRECKVGLDLLFKLFSIYCVLWDMH